MAMKAAFQQALPSATPKLPVTSSASETPLHRPLHPTARGEHGSKSSRRSSSRDRKRSSSRGKRQSSSHGKRRSSSRRRDSRTRRRRSESRSRSRSRSRRRRSPSDERGQTSAATKAQPKLKAKPFGSMAPKLQLSVSTPEVPAAVAPVNTPIPAQAMQVPTTVSATVVALGSTPSVDISGFNSVRLNCTWKLNTKEKVGQYGTYWDPQGRIFLFYRSQVQRWALSPLMDGQTNNLDKARQGTLRTVASQQECGKWKEYVQSTSKFEMVDVSMKPHDASGKLSLQAAQMLPPSVPAKERPKLKTVIVFRDAKLKDTDGKIPVKAWARPKTARVEGDIESRASSVLEQTPDCDEVTLLRDGGDKIQVALKFNSDKSAEEVKVLVKRLLFPTREPSLLQPSDAVEYNALRKRCEKVGQKVSGVAPAVASSEKMQQTPPLKKALKTFMSEGAS